MFDSLIFSLNVLSFLLNSFVFLVTPPKVNLKNGLVAWINLAFVGLYLTIWLGLTN